MNFRYLTAVEVAYLYQKFCIDFGKEPYEIVAKHLEESAGFVQSDAENIYEAAADHILHLAYAVYFFAHRAPVAFAWTHVFLLINGHDFRAGTPTLPGLKWASLGKMNHEEILPFMREYVVPRASRQ